MDKTYSQQDIIDKIDGTTIEKVNGVIKESIATGIINKAFVGNTSEISKISFLSFSLSCIYLIITH